MPDQPANKTELAIPAFVWPSTLIVGVGALLLLLLLAMTMELPMLVHGGDLPWWAPIVVVGPPIVAVLLGIGFEMRAIRRSQFPLDPPRRWFAHHFRRLPLLFIGFLVIVYGTRAILGIKSFATWQLGIGLFAYEFVRISMLYGCWLALAFAMLSYHRMRQQAEHLLAAQKTLVEAKLMQLKGQLRPHFLFNTLNTISSLMQVDVARADRMVTQLGDLLRANLDISDRDFVSLEQELELLRQYTGIMEERFIGRVKIDWAIDADASRVTIPTMLLQPLLENAFKHGVERSTVPESVNVRIHRKDACLIVTIHNSGSTLAGDYKQGWGLRNSRERLELLYGPTASLQLRNEGDGVTVELSIPWLEPGDTIDVPLSAFGL